MFVQTSWVRAESRPVSPPTHFAHSSDTLDRLGWHPLAAHLQGTAAKAADFLRAAGLQDFGRVAGLLHDVGKYTPRFQQRLVGGTDRLDHSTAGAKVALERFGPVVGRILAYCIAGHHAGLANAVNGERISSLDDRLNRRIDALHPIWEDEVTIGTIAEPPLMPRSRETAGFSVAFLIRMLFSALVDADFLDTEAYYGGLGGTKVGRGGHPRLDDLQQRLNRHLEALVRSAAGPINDLRAEILSHVRDRAIDALGSFTLTVPTGGGKTLASLAFALDHAVHHGLARVIYVIPYMSIVEQTATVFSRGTSAPRG